MVSKKRLQKLALLMVPVLFLSACGESSSNNETSVSKSLQEATSSLQEVELVTAETVESPELALALEKLSQSLELLSESITISNNQNNELLEKNTEILEGIFQNVSESNDNDSEMAKATRDLAFITFLDAMIDCLQREFTLDPERFTSSPKTLAQLQHSNICLGTHVGNDFDLKKPVYELYGFFESQEFYDLFFKRLDKLNASD